MPNFGVIQEDYIIDVMKEQADLKKKMDKSIASGTLEERNIEGGLYLLYSKNESEDVQRIERVVGLEYLQFHFCVTERMQLVFNGGNYTMPLDSERSIVLYNPQVALPMNVLLVPGASMVSLLMPIEKLHGFFSKEAHFIAFLNEENKDKKYYKEHSTAPEVITVLNQILNRSPHPIVAPLYYRAKALELLSLYYNMPQDIDLEQCPFLVDEKNVAKIRLAKEIIISRMVDPPTLQELSDEIQLPLNRLKQGFKQVYGDTVYGFLFEYKMERSRQLLASGSLNVNEVGLELGYSAASHFIAAFRRKYGTTPKKFVMGLTSS